MFWYGHIRLYLYTDQKNNLEILVVCLKSYQTNVVEQKSASSSFKKYIKAYYVFYLHKFNVRKL